MEQTVDALHANQYSTRANEQCLPQAGEGFGFTVAVAVVVIGGAQRVMHGNQIEQRCGAVQ